MNALAKCEVGSFTRSRDNSDCTFGSMGCEPPIREKGRRRPYALNFPRLEVRNLIRVGGSQPYKGSASGI